MCQSKEMLERATQRLRELEEQLEVQKNPGNVSVRSGSHLFTRKYFVGIRVLAFLNLRE